MNTSDIESHLDEIMINSFQYNGYIKHLIKKHYIENRYYHIVWILLHSFSLSITEKDIQNNVYNNNLRDFIENIHLLITYCSGGCGNHYIQYLNNYKCDVTGIISKPENVFEFFVDFHNFINNEFNKFAPESLQKKIYTYNEARDLYLKYDYISHFENLYSINICKTFLEVDSVNILLKQFIQLREKLKNTNLSYQVKCENL
jgi:hypothetical protein